MKNRIYTLVIATFMVFFANAQSISIALFPPITAFNTCLGTPSASQSITVTCNALTNNLLVSVPSGFEIEFDGSWSQNHVVPVAQANAGAITFNVRLTGSATGTFSGNFFCLSNPAIPSTRAINGTVSTSTLGSYTSTTIQTGENTTITPSSAPTVITNLTVSTSTDFTGLLEIDPTTGIINVTNAKPAGTYTVVVDDNACVSETFILTVTNPDCSSGNFNGNTSVSVGSRSYSIAIGDFNGDGNQDFATANSQDDNISIRLGDGTGGFSGSTNVSVGANPRSVAIGDFNSDGNQDFAAANADDDSVSIHLGDGSGSFSNTSNVLVGDKPYAVAIGDFNGDNIQDIAAANRDGNNVSIRLGDGSGGFSGSTNVSVGNGPFSLAIGDFNGDDNQDFITANYDGNNVSIRLGDGSGGFSNTSNLPVGMEPTSIVLGDFNGDGNQDFATANSQDDNLSIYLGNGTGSFTSSANVTTGTGPRSVAVGDFNGDGNQDIATANYNVNKFYIHLGDGSGGFFSNIDVSVGSGPYNLAIGEFNGDGILDFVTGHILGNIASVRLGEPVSLGSYVNTTIQTGANTTIAPSTAPIGTTSLSVSTSTDFTGLLNIDTATGEIHVTNAKPAGTYVISVVNSRCTLETFTLTITDPNCSAGNFSSANNISVNEPMSLAVGDFNGDGYQDFVAANANNNKIAIRLGDGNGGFSNSANISVGNDPFSVAVGDFNGDGHQDIAAANSASNTVSICLGDGIGGFTNSSSVSVGNLPYAVAISDFNGDGFQDFVTANTGSGNVSLRLGDGSGGFSGTTNISVENGPRSIAIGDFNGDGFQDFSAASYNNSSVSICLGNGSGGFSGYTSVPLGANPRSIAIGDFNGDGFQDFATANRLDDNVSIRLGDGTGGFSSSADVAVGNEPNAIVIGDFNGDGNQDFATVNSSDKTVSIKLGDGTGGFYGNTTVSFGTFPTFAAVGDFNNDGVQDFAITNQSIDNISIHLGEPVSLGSYANTVVQTGGNTTISASAAPTGTTSLSVTSSTNFTGLLDIDQTTGEIRVTNAKPAGTYTVSIKDSSCISEPVTLTLTVTDPDCSTGNFSGSTTFSVGIWPSAIAIGDFNGDGIQDFAIANSYDDNVSIKLGDGNGGFSGSTAISVGEYPQSIAIGDFNNDGNQDFATTNSFDYNISICLGDGTGGFGSSTNVSVGINPQSIVIGDFNSDGYQDFATANRSNDNKVSICFGNGKGSISSSKNISVGDQPSALAIGDFNNDGHQDVAVANMLGNNISIRLGNGNGGFSSNASVSVGNYPISVAIGDFNSDGHQDIVTGYNTGKNVSIHLGDGTGAFSGSTNISVGSVPRAVVIGDFNGDGHQDFATTNRNGNSVSVRLGDGTGAFSGNANISVGTDPFSLAIGDFNGDGIQDFAAVNNNDDNVSIKLGSNSIVWNGTTSTDWHTASNWSPDITPVECSDVVIPITGNNPIISAEVQIEDITLNSGASLTAGPNSCLTVTNSFTNNGSFVIDANTTAYGQYNGPAVTATFNQVIPEAGWHSIGSPFTDTKLSDISFDQNAFLQLGSINQANIRWYDPLSYTASPPTGSNQAWGNWVIPTDLATEPFDGTKGFNLFLNGYFADAFPVIMSVTGTLRDGNITPVLNQANGGWNLMSNPYPRVLDWEEAYDNSALANSYYVWDAANDNYATYQVGGTHTFNATQYIAPMQSVFVRTTTFGDGSSGATPSVLQNHPMTTLDAVNECDSVVNMFYKTGDKEVLLKTTSGKHTDELILMFNSDYHRTFTMNNDVLKYFSPNESVPSVFALIENQKCVFGAYPLPDNNTIEEIPLGIKTTTGKMITIEVLEKADDIKVILEDKKRNVFHNLYTPYTFNTSVSYNTGRFVLHIGNANINTYDVKHQNDLFVFVKESNFQFAKNQYLVGKVVQIYNIAGKHITSFTLDENFIAPVPSNVTKGIYLIYVETPQGIFTQNIAL